jgi:hypothetical protein
MDSLSALRKMVKHYPGSYEAMGAVVGISAEVLRKQLSGAQGFKLGVVDAELIAEACVRAQSEHCRAYANAVALQHGGFVELPVRAVMAPAELASGLAGVVQKASDMLSAGIGSIADGDVSDNECKVLRALVADLVEKVQEADRQIVEANLAGKRRREVR